MPTNFHGGIVANPDVPADMRWGFAGGRLVRDSATVLSYRRYSGDVIDVSSVLVNIDATDGIQCDVADNLIDSAGLELAATPPTADLVYFVYVCNQQATGFDDACRLCATAPARVDGVKYLGTSGNALNWRFVGQAYVDPSSEFVDTLAIRGVINEANRLLLPMETVPEYANNNAETTYAFNSATWAPIGNNSTLSWCANGEDAATFIATCAASLVGAAPLQFGVQINSDAGIEGVAINKLPAVGAHVGASVSLSRIVAQAMSQGLAVAGLNAMSGGVATTVIADAARNGLAADPAVTALRGFVRG